MCGAIKHSKLPISVQCLIVTYIINITISDLLILNKNWSKLVYKYIIDYKCPHLSLKESN